MKKVCIVHCFGQISWLVSLQRLKVISTTKRMTVSYRKREERKYDPRRKRRRIFLQDKSLLKSEGDMGEKGGEVFHEDMIFQFMMEDQERIPTTEEM